jgi:hypothetical protein
MAMAMVTPGGNGNDNGNRQAPMLVLLTYPQPPRTAEECRFIANRRGMSIYREPRRNVDLSRTTEECRFIANRGGMSIYRESRRNADLSRTAEECRFIAYYRGMSIYRASRGNVDSPLGSRGNVDFAMPGTTIHAWSLIGLEFCREPNPHNSPYYKSAPRSDAPWHRG